MSMELRRNPIPKHLFTPTQDSTNRVPTHYLLFFDDTESYQIVGRSSIKKIENDGSAIIKIRQKSIKGRIICLGSLEFCESELARQTRQSQKENDEMNFERNEEARVDESDNTTIVANATMGVDTIMGVNTQQPVFSQSRLPVASSITFDEPFIPEDEEGDDENPDEIDRFLHFNTTSTKKKPTTNKRKQANISMGGRRKRLDNRSLDDTQTDEVDIDRDIANSSFSILGALENKFSSLESQLLTIDNRYTQKMVQLAKKIDYLTSSSITNKNLLETYKDEHNENFKSEVMHENTNLLNTLASSVGDFARKNMRIVFTEEELKAQVLPPARSHLKRESLDEHRFQLVNEAVRVKFKLDATKYPAFYKNILRRKLSDFLIEERRRETNRKARQMLRAEMNRV